MDSQGIKHRWKNCRVSSAYTQNLEFFAHRRGWGDVGSSFPSPLTWLPSRSSWWLAWPLPLAMSQTQ